MSDRVGEVLYAVPGCGKCADIVAAHLMTGAFYDTMLDHLADHKPEPSIWGEANIVAARSLSRTERGEE